MASVHPIEKQLASRDSAGQLSPPRGRLAWMASGHFRRITLFVLVVFLVVESFRAIPYRISDFNGHLNEGALVLAGRIGKTRWDWYPLGRQMWNAVLAFPPGWLTRSLCYLAAIAAGYGSFRIWRRLSKDSVHVADAANAAGEEKGKTLKPTIPLHFAALMVSLAVMFTFVQRDLDECGLHIMLLYALSAAVAALVEGRSCVSGLWIAAAISFKSTPLLFIPFLLWKRCWRAASWTVVWTIVINVSPALFIGWDSMVDYHHRYYVRARTTASYEDPSLNIAEPPKPLNQSLNTALARLVQTYPPGHTLYIDHPLFFQLGDLEPRDANRFVKGSLLLLAAVLAWRMRKPWGDHPTAGGISTEWAAVITLMTLLSPFCWKQHLVMALPCLYLVMLEQLGSQRPAKWRSGIVCVMAALTLLTTQGVLGKELATLALSYKCYTIVGLLSLLLVLTLPKRSADAVAAGKTIDQSPEPEKIPQPARAA